MPVSRRAGSAVWRVAGWGLLSLLLAPTAWASGSNGTVTMLTNLVRSVAAFWMVIHNFALLLGIVLVVGSLIAITKSSREGGGVKLAVLSFVSGIFLLSIDATISSLSWSILDSAPDKAMSYTPASGTTSAYGLTVQFAVYVVQLIGLYAVVRAFYLFRESAQDRSKFYMGLVHLIGGIFSINIVILLTTVANSIGGSFQDIVTHILNG